MRILLIVIAVFTAANSSVDPTLLFRKPSPKVSHVQGRDWKLAESSEYEFRVGERLRAALLDDCFILIGVTSFVENDRLGLELQETLWGEGSKKDEVVEFELPPTNQRFSLDSPVERTSIRKGDRLLIAKCTIGGVERVRVGISDDAYFGSVRNILMYEKRLRLDPGAVSDIPSILAAQDDSLFAGYASLVLRGSSIDREAVADVMSRVMSTRFMPPVGLSLLRIRLRQMVLLTGDNALGKETRDVIISRLVSTGSRYDPSDQVFILLDEIFESSKAEIKASVNEANRSQLIRNYQVFLRRNRAIKPNAALITLLKGGQ